MGVIRLKQLTFQALHGALPHEKQIPQEFWVDLAIKMDLTAAGSSDRLEDTINYSTVADCIGEVMMGPPVDLLETLAYRMIIAVRSLDKRIQRVDVRVTKVAPPINVVSLGASVELSDGE